MKLDFRILGPLEVVADGEPLPLRGGKQRALLALLLLRANEIVPTDVLIEELWGGAPPETAANTLQVYVSQLRKALAVENGILTTQGPGYRLALEPEQLDLHRFERLVAEGREALAAGDADTAAQTLEDALALWRGAPLADLTYEAFAATEIARLEELRLAALEDRVDAALARGEQAQVVPQLESLVAQHPLRERFRAQLMLALYRSGRQADALAEYQRARTTLADELGLEPSEELRSLEQSILTHDPAIAPPTPTLPSHLPTPPTPLVGRERELADALALAGRDDVRLVTFTGPGGIGKTRLALEVARELGATAFVDLTAVTDPDLVAPAIVATLGIGEGARSPLEALEEHLAPRQVTLLLDNFEQVVDAAPMLARLLSSAPRLRLLVTSRILLRVSGEFEFSVPPLAHGSAVELFAQRAEAVDPEFALTPQTAGAVAEIAQRLEGLPLAIELAAARTRLLPPPALLERLTSRLAVLTSGARDVPERQQTLRATLDWSHALLDVDEQRLFARLALFIGGCSLDAVEAVCSDGADTLALLESLVDKSLIRRLRTDEPRFAMLETVREYASERLADSGEAPDVRARYVAFYADLARRGETAVEGPEQPRWLALLERDHANLRAAIAMALEDGNRVTAINTAAALRRFWLLHGHLEIGLAFYDEVLRHEDAAPVDVRARAWNGLGILAGERGDFERAREAFERSLAAARELGDPARIAAALSNLGNLALFSHELKRARELYEESAAIRREAGIEHGLDILVSNLGLVALAEGNLDDAKRLFEEALALARERGGRHTAAISLRGLVRIALERGEFDDARRMLAESFALVAEIEQTQGFAEGLDIGGMLAAAEGEAERAAELFGAADATRTTIGALQAPETQEACERWMTRLRGELGDDAFAAAFERGSRLDPDVATALAINKPH